MLKLENNMEEKDIKKLIRKELKSSFSQKRVGDTPTDALQLVNKKYVDENGGAASGSVVSNAAGTNFPADWSVAHSLTGVYTFTHTLGTSHFAVTITVNGTNLVTIPNVHGKSTTQFIVNLYNQTGSITWSAADTDFDFIVS